MNSISLIQAEQLWAQYWQLKEGLLVTEKMLRALGVEEFPESPPNVKSNIASYVAQPVVGVSSTFPKIKLTDLVREACKNIKINITRDAVVEYINNHYPGYIFKTHSVATLLSSAMVKENLVVLQQDPVGGQQNKYVLVEEWL